MAKVNQGGRRVDSEAPLRQLPACGKYKPLWCIAGAILKHELDWKAYTRNLEFRAIGSSCV